MLTTRSLVRAPIALYRHGWGWVFGERILMLEHIGRKSGLPRYVCLEVVDRPARDRLIIVSGFGRHAQWYRNLAEHPQCRVSIGRDVAIPASARLMSERESDAALARYQQVHPRAWKLFRRAIERAVRHPVVGLPMVELSLTCSRHGR
jgi:deazaflavin-dependent oxidoreductase (nitroreductase family)